MTPLAWWLRRWRGPRDDSRRWLAIHRQGLRQSGRGERGRTSSRLAARPRQNLDVLRALSALAVLTVHAYALGGRALPVKAQYGYDVPLSALASTASGCSSPSAAT